MVISLIVVIFLLLVSIVITTLLSPSASLIITTPGASQSTFVDSATTTMTAFKPLATSTRTRTATRLPSASPTATQTMILSPLSATPASDLPPSNVSSVQIEGVVGHAQRYTLDCEARSAVDWAAYFGVDIPEDDFLALLPKSDDPEEGFVGSFNGMQGQLPPDSYGVHAAPVAKLLRSYGLPALDVKQLSWEELQAELKAGSPVIAWVIFLVEDGSPVSYTASNGNTTIVARYEHTVIITGYDDTRVSIVDGAYTYHRSIEQFLRSWSVLGNMAIVNRK